MQIKLSGLWLLTIACADLNAQAYDVAAFYWPPCHYEPRIEFRFPEQKGEWEIIYKSGPKEVNHDFSIPAAQSLKKMI